MKGRFSKRPLSSSVAKISASLRISTQSPALRFKACDRLLFRSPIAFFACLSGTKVLEEDFVISAIVP